jgi:two-component system, NtrC family, nitrogen regulation sensor histidine kinase NtrY
MALLSNRPATAGIPHRLILGACAVLILALLATQGFESVRLSAIGETWPADSASAATASSLQIQNAFQEYQHEILEVAEKIAVKPELRAALLSNDDSTGAGIFDFLQSADTRGWTIEIFDDGRRAAGWVGNRGPMVDTNRLSSHPVSYVSQGAIYTWVIAAVPIGDSAKPAGYCVAKRLFDVNFPLNTRFVSNDAFQSTFHYDEDVDFDFPPDTAHRNGGVLTIPLQDVSGNVIGSARVPRLQIDIRREQLVAMVRTVQSLIVLLGAAIILWYLILAVGKKSGRKASVTLTVVSLWFIRYLLAGLDLPGRIFRPDIFNPKYFASPFGAGIAGSLGDLALSAIVLVISVYLIAREVLARWSGMADQAPATTGGSRGVGLAWSAVIVILLLSALRGVGATFQSAVVDSSLPYNDPASVIPSYELCVMLVSLFLIAFSFVLAGVTVIGALRRQLSRIYSRQPGTLLSWSVTGIVLIFSGLLYGLLVPNALFGQWSRILILAALFAASVRMGRESRGDSGLAGSAYVLMGVIAALMLVQTLDHRIHDLDRSRTEAIAHDLQRPEDTWLRFLVGQTLSELTDSTAADILENGTPADIDKLAFTGWARSVLSREGNNCAVVYYDRNGRNVSRFHLGFLPHAHRDTSSALLPASSSVQIDLQIPGGAAFKVYNGSAPVLAPDSSVAGGVRVEVSGGRQLFLRGEGSDLMRTLNRDDLTQHFRQMTVSEYFQGKLLSSTDETLPLSRMLPIQAKNSVGALWLNENVNGQEVESYYCPDETDPQHRTWISLSMPVQGARWHLYVYLRYFIFFLGLSAGILLLVFLNGMMRGKTLAPRFRTRLLLAFVITALIPVIILAYYNRVYSTERRAVNTIRRLNEQTSAVVAELQRQFGISVPAALAEVTDEQCGDIANDLNAEFNVYFGYELQASSKPEMFTAELLDPTISSTAFNHLFLKRERFYSEPQSIGSLPYMVGYRPLVSEDGSVIGVVSVPSLYRQSEVDEDLARRNVFLYGAYAVALMLSLVAGTIFANQIAAPIRRLRTATQRLAGGNLDVELSASRSDELGELEQSFAKMTVDLRQAQDQMVRTQRELAWKEMARQVAHEIKNPLTPIQLSIQHLRQAYSDGVKNFSEVLGAVTTTILEQITALNRIASEFSQFARMPDRKPVRCDTREIMLEAAALFRVEGLVIREEFTPEAAAVIADREEFRRAIINIIRNAVQAMNNRGTLTLAAAVVSGKIEISVTDDGPGIPDEIRGRLFEPNFSTKTEGMGLGLSIVRKTIEDIGGTVVIESVPGRGTTVTMTLPPAPEGKG